LATNTGNINDLQTEDVTLQGNIDTLASDTSTWLDTKLDTTAQTDLDMNGKNVTNCLDLVLDGQSVGPQLTANAAAIANLVTDTIALQNSDTTINGRIDTNVADITALNSKTQNMNGSGSSTVFTGQLIVDGGTNPRIRTDKITNTGGFTSVDMTNSILTITPGQGTPTVVAATGVSTPAVLLPGGDVETQLDDLSGGTTTGLDGQDGQGGNH